jgi:hypothetical protein
MDRAWFVDCRRRPCGLARQAPRHAMVRRRLFGFRFRSARSRHRPGESWKGPRIAYIDIFAYPFYRVFAAHNATTALGRLNA